MNEREIDDFKSRSARIFFVLLLTVMGALCVACIAGLYSG